MGLQFFFYIYNNLANILPSMHHHFFSKIIDCYLFNKSTANRILAGYCCFFCMVQLEKVDMKNVFPL